MSDLTDFTAALIELKRLVQPDVDPLLTYSNGAAVDLTKDLDAILENNKRARTFAVATAHTTGQVVMPTARNGYRYRVVIPGTSGAAEPTWPTSYEGQVTSGASNPVLTFEEAGPEFSNIYDVRGAAKEAWMLKASKASEYLEEEEPVYKRCIEQANRYASIGVA